MATSVSLATAACSPRQSAIARPCQRVLEHTSRTSLLPFPLRQRGCASVNGCIDPSMDVPPPRWRKFMDAVMHQWIAAWTFALMSLLVILALSRPSISSTSAKMSPCDARVCVSGAKHPAVFTQPFNLHARQCRMESCPLQRFGTVVSLARNVLPERLRACRAARPPAPSI